MIAAILRKDWETLRAPVIGVGAMQVAYALIQLQVDAREGMPILPQLAQLLSWTWLLAAALLIILVVHQDAPRSVDQDWLTRPLSRGQMFAAKVLFAIVFVQGWSALADVIQGLGAGFPPLRVFVIAGERAAFLFLVLTLPALAVGAVTTRVGEALVAAVAGALGIFAFTMLAIGTAGGYGHSFDATDFTGEGWITNLVRYVIVFAGLAATIRMQYQVPRRGSPRIALAATLVAVLLTQLIPWHLVFAIQERLSTALQSANEIRIEWDRSGDVVKAPPVREIKQGQWQLPLAVTGLRSGAWLIADKVILSVRDTNGAIIGKSESSTWSVSTDPGIAQTDILEIPEGKLKRAPTGNVSLQPDFSLTLLAPSAQYQVPVESGETYYPGWGRCSTRLAEGGDAVWLSCRQIGKGPTCARVTLESDTVSNPESRHCDQDYAPWRDHPLPDALARWRITLPFRDPVGLVRYPVGPDQWRNARIHIRKYEAVAHFRRVLAPRVVSIVPLSR